MIAQIFDHFLPTWHIDPNLEEVRKECAAVYFGWLSGHLAGAAAEANRRDWDLGSCEDYPDIWLELYAACIAVDRSLESGEYQDETARQFGRVSRTFADVPVPSSGVIPPWSGSDPEPQSPHVGFETE